MGAASTSRLILFWSDNPCLISREKQTASCLERRREVFMRTSIARTLCNLHVASAVHNLLAGYRLAHRSSNESRTRRTRNICDAQNLRTKSARRRNVSSTFALLSEGLEEVYSQAQLASSPFNLIKPVVTRRVS